MKNIAPTSIQSLKSTSTSIQFITMRVKPKRNEIGSKSQQHRIEVKREIEINRVLKQEEKLTGFDAVEKNSYQFCMLLLLLLYIIRLLLRYTLLLLLLWQRKRGWRIVPLSWRETESEKWFWMRFYKSVKRDWEWRVFDLYSVILLCDLCIWFVICDFWIPLWFWFVSMNE